MAVADRSGAPGRIDDIGEHHCRQYAVEIGIGAVADTRGWSGGD
jgi:hypothetical protein